MPTYRNSLLLAYLPGDLWDGGSTVANMRGKIAAAY